MNNGVGCFQTAPECVGLPAVRNNGMGGPKVETTPPLFFFLEYRHGGFNVPRAAKLIRR